MTTIRTGVGRAGAGDYDQFGLRVYRDLVGHTSYLGLIAFGLTGHRLTREQEALLDDLVVSSHVSEPRVFPIKLTWIVGSLGRAMPAYSVGTIVLDSDILGGRVGEDAARSLVDLAGSVEGTEHEEEAIRDFIAANKHLYGFGVPFRVEDERVVAFRRALAQRAHTPGRYWQLAERFWRIVRETRKVEVNIIGVTAALCLDFGFTPAQVAPMAVTLLQPTFLMNATEAAAQAPACLRRLPDDCVRYEGPPPRRSPRALASERAGERASERAGERASERG